MNEMFRIFARTSLIDIQDLSDEELDRPHEQFKALHKTLDKRIGKRKPAAE